MCVQINFTLIASSVFLVHYLQYVAANETYQEVLSFLAKSWMFSEREDKLSKLTLNSSFCAVSTD